ncbi:alpha-amylase family glycosyl hydrolase [Flavobacteriaceae bacterium TK19130]|nr:alpha-amylase family glycosyl hydrolase [Thermobacterium salinum]
MVLIRDFDADHSFESLIDRLEYLDNLVVNAIELMPVSEFDGNISWGYNPSFHMALDKYYGNKNSFKAFVDACHERGIAVILDVVYNHATGQNPYFRIYNDCNGCYGGQATAENPIFNVEDPNSTFSFFNDIDHESVETQYYVDRLNKFWLEEYNIDGYRFDFTKGFTNTPGDGGAYDASRIALLQRMYDEIRSVDPSAYVILEHFAPNEEETELIEYQATSNPDEPGMMVWSNHNFHYNEATMGYNSNSDFSWINYQNRGWDTPSNIAYMESHDEERLMYKNLEFGNSEGSYDVTELATATDRVEMAGAFFFTIPGPKLIWQFGELGYDFSINYCEDGSINNACRVDPKPLPWPLGYNTQQDRNDLYHAFRTFIGLRQQNPIFHTDTFSLDVGNADGVKKIHLEDPSATGDEIRFVTIVGNFSVFEQTFNPEFQETGTWFNMMDGSEITVNNANEPFTLAPGEYFIYANEESVLNTSNIAYSTIKMYPNPTADSVHFTENATEIIIFDAQGKKLFVQYSYNANSPIDLSGLPMGLYFAKALTNNGLESFKILKK